MNNKIRKRSIKIKLIERVMVYEVIVGECYLKVSNITLKMEKSSHIY